MQADASLPADSTNSLTVKQPMKQGPGHLCNQDGKYNGEQRVSNGRCGEHNGKRSQQNPYDVCMEEKHQPMTKEAL